MEMTLVFHFYQGKFGFHIFMDLKSKQIRYKKPKFANIFVNLTKTKFVYTFKILISQKLDQLDSNKFSVITIGMF